MTMTTAEALLIQQMSDRISDVGSQLNEQRRQGDERYHELRGLLSDISADLRVHRVTGNGDDAEDVQAAPERGRLRRKVLTRENITMAIILKLGLIALASVLGVDVSIPAAMP